MKYLICQDLHIKGINSENRIGNYYSDVMTKIKEIISIAKDKEVNSILCGGDVFEIPKVSDTIVDELVDLIEESGICWQVVPGNHDMVGHYWKNSDKSRCSLSHIFRRSKMINKFEWEMRFDPEIQTCYFEGFPYYHTIEQDLKEKGLYYNINNFKTKSEKNSYKIALVHALIVKKQLPTELCIPYKNIKTDFDIVFVSHNHLQWGIIEHNGVKFVNLGCIGRRKSNEYSIEPTVAIFDTEDKSIELIKLKSAKLGKEVFDLEKVEKNKAYENDVNNFIDILNTEKVETLELMDIVEQIAKQSKIEKEVKDEVVRRIE